MENRCPQWLNIIHTVDSRWWSIDEECQNFLHKRILYTELRNYRNKIGNTVFDSIIIKFQDIDTYGYDFSDLHTLDLTVIKR